MDAMRTFIIPSRDRVTTDWVWIGNQFSELLQLVPTSNDYALTVLHTWSSQSVTVITNRCLVAASNGGRSPSPGFPNFPRTSSTSFWQQQFTRTETQQSSNLLTAVPNLSCLYIGTDRTENAVLLLQCDCCVRVCWGVHVIATQPLPSNGRCLQSHYLATALV
jgi:hypothetical protein